MLTGPFIIDFKKFKFFSYPQKEDYSRFLLTRGTMPDEGEIKVNGTLTVQEQGEISGNIEYQEMQIKLGGKIQGDIKSLDKIKKLSDVSITPLQATTDKKDSKSL